MGANSKKVMAFSFVIKGTERYFSVRVAEGPKTLATKTRSIGRDRNEDEAYAEILDAAKELSKKFKVPVPEVDKEQLIHTAEEKLKAKGVTAEKPTTPKSTAKSESIQGLTTLAAPKKLSSGKTPSAKKPAPARKIVPEITTDENGGNTAFALGEKLLERYGHPARWKSFLKALVKNKGIDRIDEMFASAREFLDEIKEEARREDQIISAANRDIARIIIKARASGVAMQASPEIEDCIRILEKEDRRVVPGRKGQLTGFFKLGDTIWNADKDRIPAEFSAWLQADRERDMEELRYRP